MKKAALFLAVTGLLAAPVQAQQWNDARTGTFVGARLTVGGNGGSRPRAALTIAPTVNQISYDGRSNMRIGEGLALNLTPGARPTLTLAGVRADTALGLRPQAEADGEQRLGLSTGGKIAIGVGAAILVGAGVGYLVLSNRCTECDQ